MKKDNPYDEKYVNPNANFDSLMGELRYRISRLELDIININDTELKGMAQQLYTDLSIKYFKLMRDDLFLQSMFQEEEE